jgi:hypothetical protein
MIELKYTLIIISLLSTLSCQRTKIEDIWIKTTSSNSSIFDEIHLLSFKNDSVHINTFFNVGIFKGIEFNRINSLGKSDSGDLTFEEKGKYSIEGEKLIFSLEDQSDTFKINLFKKNKLELSGSFKDYNNYGVRNRLENVKYIRIPKYKQSKNEAKLTGLLNENLYQLKTKFIDEQLKIEFFNNNRFQLSAMQGYRTQSHVWYLKKHGKELFLIFDSVSPYPLHIKKITEKEITGILHGKENIEFKLIKTSIKQDLKNIYLQGKWEEKSPKSSKFPPPPPTPPPPTGSFYEKEIIEI